MYAAQPLISFRSAGSETRVRIASQRVVATRNEPCIDSGAPACSGGAPAALNEEGRSGGRRRRVRSRPDTATAGPRFSVSVRTALSAGVARASGCGLDERSSASCCGRFGALTEASGPPETGIAERVADVGAQRSRGIGYGRLGVSAEAPGPARSGDFRAGCQRLAPWRSRGSVLGASASPRKRFDPLHRGLFRGLFEVQLPGGGARAGIRGRERHAGRGIFGAVSAVHRGLDSPRVPAAVFMSPRAARGARRRSRGRAPHAVPDRVAWFDRWVRARWTDEWTPM